MKKLGLAVLILAALSFGGWVPPASAGWVELGISSASGGGISNNPGGSYFPGLNCTPLVIGADGNPIVAWADNTNGNWEIYARRWDGSAWVEMGANSATSGGVSNDSGASDGPALAIGGDGNPILAWYDNTSGDYEIYVKKWDGSAWVEMGANSATSGGISNNSGKSSHLSIAIGSDGNPVVAWEDNSGGNDEIYVRKWNGSSWAVMGTNSASGGGISSNSGMSRTPMVIEGGDGNPVVAWEDYTPGNWDIYVKKWDGSSWVVMATGSASGGGIISNNSGDSLNPYLALGLDGNPIITWWDNTSGNYEIYVKKWDGSAWAVMGAGSASGGGISNNPGISERSSLAVGPDGYPVITWWDDTPGNGEIYVRKWNGSAWVELTAGSATGGGISKNPGASLTPFLAFGPDGKLVLAWDDNTCGNQEVYVLKLDPDLEPAGNLQAAPGDGQALLSWEKSTSAGTVSYWIYADGLSETTHCSGPVMSVLHPQESATLGGLVNGQTYLISLETMNSSNELTMEPNQVSVTPVTSTVGLVRAAIKIPKTGKRVAGNRILVMAELEYGSPLEVMEVRFQFKPETGTVWADIPPADPANHPNPDSSYPYFVHWDVTGLASGSYDIRAVAIDNIGNPDPEPPYITIVVDNQDPEEVTETCGSGCIQETKGKVFQGRTNDICLGHADSNSFDRITLPEGALNGVTDTVIITYEDPAEHAGKCPADKDCSAGEYRTVTLVSGQTALSGGQIATIRMSYRDDDNDGILDGTSISESMLKPHRWISGTDWEELPVINIDTVSKQVKFATDHFSLFGLFGTVTAPAGGSTGGGIPSAGACGGSSCGSGGDLGFSFLAVLGGMFWIKRKIRE